MFQSWMIGEWNLNFQVMKWLEWHLWDKTKHFVFDPRFATAYQVGWCVSVQSIHPVSMSYSFLGYYLIWLDKKKLFVKMVRVNICWLANQKSFSQAGTDKLSLCTPVQSMHSAESAIVAVFGWSWQSQGQTGVWFTEEARIKFGTKFVVGWIADNT